jgi:hypothetical protein
VVRVTAGGGSFAALGVEALDGRGAGEDAVALVTDDMDEEPGNGVGIRRRGIGDGFSIDAAGVTGHPGWSGEMLAEEIALGVEEVGIGSFQNPGELGTIGFARINLIALGVKSQEELLGSGRLELRGDLLRGRGIRKKCDACKESQGSDGAQLAEHGASPPVGERLSRDGQEYNAVENVGHASLHGQRKPLSLAQWVRESGLQRPRRPRPTGN